MPGTVMPDPRIQFLSDTGDPLNGGKLFTYAAGTSTPEAVYTDVDLTVAHANPVILDAAGRAQIYLAPKSYKFVLQTSAGATVWTADNVVALQGASSTNLDITGTAGEALLLNDAVYLSDGSGGKTAGRWYKATANDDYSSLTPEIGFATAAISSGASGLIRVAGVLTGLSSLTPGALYFVLAVAGTIGTTAPARTRIVGQALTSTTLLVAPTPTDVLNLAADPRRCDGRLTLTSGTPVTTADVTAAGTIYFTPYLGNRVSLYDGARWKEYRFTERSLALVITSGFNYDVFLYDNAGTLTLELTQWTNDTTRATAIALQDGVKVRSGAPSRRLLGTIRATAANQTEDSDANRGVSNEYNRVPRRLYKADATASWTYDTASFRQANGAAANQCTIVVCSAEVRLSVQYSCVAGASGAGLVSGRIGIGIDSTTALAAGNRSNAWISGAGAGSLQIPATAALDTYPAVGRHTVTMIEFGAGATTTFYGTLTYSGSATLSGWIDG